MLGILPQTFRNGLSSRSSPPNVKSSLSATDVPKEIGDGSSGMATQYQPDATEKQTVPSVTAEDGSNNIQSSEKDMAAAIVPERAQELDPLAEQRVLRKIDFFLIPLMWIGYGFVYYDKVPAVSHCS